MSIIVAALMCMSPPPVGDVRNVHFDPTLRASYSAKWAAWSRIYQRYADWTGARLELPTAPIRAAAEFRVRDAPDFRTLRAAGYNAVVLLVDESDIDRLNVIHAAHAAGLLAFIAYCPPRESLEETVYPDPDRLGAVLRRMGAAADALLIGWRRTSVHLLRQDRPYTAYLIASARADRPDLPVIGEIYAGPTNDHAVNLPSRPAVQIPPESGAVIVVNFDQPGISPVRASEWLSGAVTPLRKLFIARNRASGEALATAGIVDIIELINQ